MISPHTSPGTKVVCIDAECSGGFLADGSTYTVAQITEGRDAVTCEFGIGAVLHEIPPCNCFGLDRFRLAVLPSCLTELLNTTKLPEKEKA